MIKLDEPTRRKMPDRCICGCGRFVDAPGEYATDWCRENHAVNLGTLREIELQLKYPEEPDIVY